MSQPRVNLPNGAQPDRTQPDRTQPDRTQPDRTQPDRTQPDRTQPGRVEGPASPSLDTLQRPAGGFAMLAVDQREAMRAMFAEHTAAAVPDSTLRDFKVGATRILTPYASAVLVDRQFAFDAVVEQRAVAPSCGLIAAADDLIPAHGELVGRVAIDRRVVPERVKEQGAVALKLLVLWRADESPAARVAMVGEFVDCCHAAGLLSIIEPIARGRADGRPSDIEAGVLAAARELGGLGADLYKAEVPLKGQGDVATVRRRCAEITATVQSPWVVLSSGVPQDDFPHAVASAMAEGASGFLAGRAVWASCIGAEDVEHELQTAAVTRLQGLASVVDEQMAARR